MRRENERLLQEHITEYMEEAKTHIEKADVIFLHAPGMNKTLFLSEAKPLAGHMHKVRSIEFKSKKANFQEAVELIKKITEVKLHFNQEYISPLSDLVDNK
jgi:Bacteroidetes VLRF1 release factor